MFTKIILLFGVLFSFGAEANLCGQLSKKSNAKEVVQLLAEKIKYSHEELCNHRRILAIQDEPRSFYYADTDDFEEHTVITLHYSEYSCEYHYNNPRRIWITERQHCYNTW